MPDQSSIQPFIPRPLHPLQAYLDNALLTRAQPWSVAIGATPAELHAEHAQFPFSPIATAYFTCADQDICIEFSSLDCIRLHPAMAQVPQNAHLPADVLLAIMELVLTPLLPALQAFMGSAITLQKISLTPEVGSWPVATLHLRMTIKDLDSAQPPLALRILVFNEQTAQILAERLFTLPARQIKPEENALPITVSIEAGSMRLSLDELSSLEKNDILLPPAYLGNQGQIRLRIDSNGMATAQTLLCAVSDHVATVTTIKTLPKETSMPSTDARPPETSAATPEQAETQSPTAITSDQADVPSQASIDVSEFEVELCFELERRLMSVKEIAALTPGYTFSLGCSPLAPVTLRVHEKVLGTGSLVDLNGVLGVQITALHKTGESNDRH